MRQPGVSTISVQRDRFVFSAAHFAQLPDGTSEPLHGHNYSVRVEVAGPVDDDGYVCSFAEVKTGVVGITEQLNHRVLLPTESSRLSIEKVGPHLEVVADGREYRFPSTDAALLPIPNTTCECLAAFVGMQLAALLVPLSVRIELAESRGQAAMWSPLETESDSDAR